MVDSPRTSNGCYGNWTTFLRAEKINDQWPFTQVNFIRGSQTSRLGLLPALSFRLRSSRRYCCRYSPSSPSSAPTNSLIFYCSQLRSSLFRDRYTLSWRCCLRRSLGSLSSSQTEGAASVLARCRFFELAWLPFSKDRGVFFWQEGERSVLRDFPLHFLLIFSFRSCDFCLRSWIMSSLQTPVCPSTTVTVLSPRMLSIRCILAAESNPLNPLSLRQRSWCELALARPISCRWVSTNRSKSSQRLFTALALNNRMTRGSSNAFDNQNSLKYRMNIVMSNRVDRAWFLSNVSFCTHMDFRQKSNIISSFFSTLSLYVFHFSSKRLSSLLFTSSSPTSRTMLISLCESASELVPRFCEMASEAYVLTWGLCLRVKSLMALRRSQRAGNSRRRQSFWSMLSSMWLYSPNSLALRWSVNWQKSLTVMAPPVRMLINSASLMSRSRSIRFSCRKYSSASRFFMFIAIITTPVRPISKQQATIETEDKAQRGQH